MTRIEESKTFLTSEQESASFIRFHFLPYAVFDVERKVSSAKYLLESILLMFWRTRLPSSHLLLLLLVNEKGSEGVGKKDEGDEDVLFSLEKRDATSLLA